MISTELKRANDGKLHLYHAGQPVDGAVVVDIGFNAADGQMYAKVLIPTKSLQFGEVTNVVPFIRPAEK